MIFRSKVLETAVTGNFKEKDEKRIKMSAYSAQAVQQFVKFLYGFELEEENPKGVVMDLIEMGGVYSVENLQIAASIFVPKILTKGNMMEMMDFLKTHKALAALDLCTEFLLENSDRNALQSSDLLSKHPEIAVHLLRGTTLRQNTIQLYERKTSMIINYEKDQTVSQDFKIEPILNKQQIMNYIREHTTYQCVFTGLGLALCKGAEVEVCIYAQKEDTYNRKLGEEEKIYHGTVINLTNEVLPIFFQKEVSCKKYHNNSVEVRHWIKG